jgi:N-acetylglucosaminyl-diphospho-decaprenol L-rhamnosyltransferase
MPQHSNSTNSTKEKPVSCRGWDVAIIIVAYEGDAWIPSCMESLQTSTNINALVLLVDNKDNTDLKSEKLGTLTVNCFKTPHPMGFADANNFALMKVPLSVPYISFLNQDTISQKHWLEEGLECLRQNPQIGAVSPMLKNYQGTNWDHDFQNSLCNQPDFKEKWLEETTSTVATQHHIVDDIPATAMIIRTEIIKQTGPFDPFFGSYYEDYDLCMRIRKLNSQLAVCPLSKIFHYSGSISQSPEARKRRSRWVIRNRTIHKIRKSQGPRLILLWNFMILEAAIQITRSILKTPSSSPFRSVMMGYIDLIPVIPRLISKTLDLKKWNEFLKNICWQSFATKPLFSNEDPTR